MRYHENKLLNNIWLIQKPGETILIYKQILRDRKRLKISNGARYLHCLLRSLDETANWKITIAGLCTESSTSKPTVLKQLNELRKFGLVETELRYRENTKIPVGYTWTIYPIPKQEYSRRTINEEEA